MLTYFSNAFMFGKAKYIGEIAISYCSLKLWSGPPEIARKKKTNKKSNKYVK